MSNNKTGRKIIAALEVSVDGFIEGPNGEMDWLATEDEEAWRDIFEMLTHIDTCLLGRGAYPGYQQYWRAILANPEGVSPFTSKVFSKREIDYAHFADKTPHIVLSKTLDQVDWKNTQVVRDVEEIRRLKQRSGKDIYAIGGATLVSGLMNLGLIDEVRLLVNLLILGGGKALFKDVKDRHALKLVQAKPFKSGLVSLTYVTQPEKM